MSGLFGGANVGLIIGLGLVLICALSLVLSLNDPRNAQHPEGRKGRMRDELMVLSTFAPMLAMILIGSAFGHLRDSTWWLPLIGGLALMAVVGTFLPAVARARRRLVVLRGSSPR